MRLTRVPAWIKVALAVFITLILGVTVFLGLLSAYVEGTDVKLTELAKTVAVICFTLSLISWVLVFRLWRDWERPLLVAVGSGIICSVTYGMVGLTDIGFGKAPYANRFVFEAATYGAITVVLVMLILASSISVIYEIVARKIKDRWQRSH